MLLKPFIALLITASVQSQLVHFGHEDAALLPYFPRSSGSEVFIEDGAVFPVEGVSRDGRLYYSYLRVPYAEAPVGDLRFLPPVKNKPFGYLHSTKGGPPCAQFDIVSASDYVGEEDCLYLNVHVPAMRHKRPLPVMVYFHHGALMWSSASHYGADYFMDQDVIIVTVNYRLGILGFLNAGIPEAQGNMGLKDQTFAMHWVQRNIAAFGGNPELVTIFGDLAGGFAVHYHMYSEYSKGLFSAAISMSGTALDPFAYMRYPDKLFRQIVSIMGMDPDYEDRRTLVDRLKTIDPVTLVNRTIPGLRVWSVYPSIPMGPSVEIVDGFQPFITQPPIAELEKPPMNNVPWMVGFNDLLGSFSALHPIKNETLNDDLNYDWLNIAPQLLYYNDFHSDDPLGSKVTSTEIWRYYFGNLPINNDTALSFVNLNSDRQYLQSGRRSILNHCAQTRRDPQALFLYQLSHWSNDSFAAVDGHPGVAEVDDMQYLFSNTYPYFPFIDRHHPNYEFSKNLVSLWVHFGTNRDTSSFEWKHRGRSVPLNWPPADRAALLRGRPLQLLNIGNQVPEMIDEPFKERADFLDTLPVTEYEWGPTRFAH